MAYFYAVYVLMHLKLLCCSHSFNRGLCFGTCFLCDKQNQASFLTLLLQGCTNAQKFVQSDEVCVTESNALYMLLM